MSLFDNMMNNTDKNQKATNNKRNTLSSTDRSKTYSTTERGTFKEEFAKDFETNNVSKNTNFSGVYADPEPKSENSKSSSFSEEFSEDLTHDVSHFGIQSYSKAGVTFEKVSETQARVKYDGLLAKSGAQEVTGVFGFGSNQSWENVSSLDLRKENENSFMAVIPVEQGKNINIAFKDKAENWDNNSGMNYTFVN